MLQFFYSTIFSLPEWAREVVRTKIDLLEYFLATHFAGVTQSTEMKKAKAGFLIKEMLDRFKNKTLSRLSPDRKIWVYSAHDNTIINTLNALGIYDVIFFLNANELNVQ